jgi:hypothetical protein
MTREDKMINDIRTGYFPSWDGSPVAEDVAKDVRRLYELPKDSKEYFKLKAEVIGYLGRNCIEELSRGKQGQGMLTRIMFDNLYFELIELEREK